MSPPSHRWLLAIGFCEESTLAIRCAPSGVVAIDIVKTHDRTTQVEGTAEYII